MRKCWICHRTEEEIGGYGEFSSPANEADAEICLICAQILQSSATDAAEMEIRDQGLIK